MGTVQAFVRLRRTTMPSADFRHVIRGDYSHSKPVATRRISRGKHASLRTRAPSIPAMPIMDRGLCRVLSACGGSPPDPRVANPACGDSALVHRPACGGVAAGEDLDSHKSTGCCPNRNFNRLSYVQIKTSFGDSNARL